jgi:hypothetical protein
MAGFAGRDAPHARPAIKAASETRRTNFDVVMFMVMLQDGVGEA